jgi:hypothetical protein
MFRSSRLWSPKFKTKLINQGSCAYSRSFKFFRAFKVIINDPIRVEFSECIVVYGRTLHRQETV